MIKSQARRLAPALTKSGLGLVSDIVKKKNLKSALKNRGKSLGRVLSKNLIASSTKAIKGSGKVKKRQSSTKRRLKRVKRRSVLY